MQQTYASRTILTLAVGLLLVAAGCFQPAGSGFEQPITTNVQSTFTPFIPPTVEVIATDVPQPTQAPELEIILPTSEPVVPTAVAAVPTNTSAPLFPTSAFPTTDPAINALLTPQATATVAAAPLEVAQANLNPFEITATYIVGQATLQAALPLTQTAAAIIGLPTATPAGIFPTAGPTSAIFPTAGVNPGVDCIHEVQNTDANLFRIALAYGVTVEAIAARSGITNVNLIYVGQQLTIPGCGTTGIVPPATSIPTGTGQIGLTPGAPGSGGGRIHVVVQNQTLFEISLLYNVPVATIAAANGISNINLIYIGQELTIP
jgi:LysM repeat protein